MHVYMCTVLVFCLPLRLLAYLPQSLYDRVQSILLYQYQSGLTICMYIVPNTLTKKLSGNRLQRE